MGKTKKSQKTDAAPVSKTSYRAGLSALMTIAAKDWERAKKLVRWIPMDRFSVEELLKYLGANEQAWEKLAAWVLIRGFQEQLTPIQVFRFLSLGDPETRLLASRFLIEPCNLKDLCLDWLLRLGEVDDTCYGAVAEYLDHISASQLAVCRETVLELSCKSRDPRAGELLEKLLARLIKAKRICYTDLAQRFGSVTDEKAAAFILEMVEKYFLGQVLVSGFSPGDAYFLARHFDINLLLPQLPQ